MFWTGLIIGVLLGVFLGGVLAIIMCANNEGE